MNARTSIGINVALPGAHAAALVQGVVKLVGDVEWSPPLEYRMVIQKPGPTPNVRPCVVRAKKLAEDMSRLLGDPAIIQYTIFSRPSGVYPHAQLSVRASPEGDERLWLKATSSFTSTHAAEQWFTAFAKLAAMCHVNGGLAVVDDYLNAKQDVTLTKFSTREPDTHKDRREVGRMAFKQERLGRDFVFFPRWGTWISHTHAAAVGGIDAIRSRVDPAVIEDVGSAWYVQVTTLEEARSAEAADKIARFTALVEPLLPPA